MPADRATVAEMLTSMGKDAATSIGVAIQQVRSNASLNGAYGGSRMFLLLNSEAAKAFRAAANAMGTKIRAYAGPEAPNCADLLEAELTRIQKEVVATESRRAHSGGGRTSIDPMVDQLDQELTRARNDTVRDLKYLPLDVPLGGTSITITGNQGPVNVAAGTGNTANQALKGVSGQDLLGVLSQIRSDLNRQSIAPERMIEISDHLEPLELEAAKPAPDKGRIMRFAKRLGETAEKLSVAIAPKLLEMLMKAGQ